jgi:hypothetical protein
MSQRKSSDGGNIKVSRHGNSRWNQWTDSPGIDPDVAWDNAITLGNHGLYCEEARYHSDTETVLFVSPSDQNENVDESGDTRVLVTVIDATTCKSECKSAINQNPRS